MVNKIQLTNNTDTNIVVKKRGRKSKKELELIQQGMYNFGGGSIRKTLKNKNKRKTYKKIYNSNKRKTYIKKINTHKMTLKN